MPTVRGELDQYLRKAEALATILGDDGWQECIYDQQLPDGTWRRLPRWKVSARWIEFECGCVAERCRDLDGYVPSDPVIFWGTDHQAVYEHVCGAHRPAMNKRCGLGDNPTFGQWYHRRRRRLMRKAG